MRQAPRLRPALQSAGHPLAKKRLGKGQGYVYPHDDPTGFEVDYLPDELKGTTYYTPSGSGEEAEET